tara:strand:- start:1926 stop:2120 length:195 start_codon:yes stop_codon:yes gene_type:complete
MISVSKLKNNIENKYNTMNKDIQEIPLGDLYITSFLYSVFILLLPKTISFFLVGLLFGYIWSKT